MKSFHMIFVAITVMTTSFVLVEHLCIRGSVCCYIVCLFLDSVSMGVVTLYSQYG